MTTNTDLETFPVDVLEQLLVSLKKDEIDLIGSVGYWNTIIKQGLKSKETSLDLLGRWHNERKAKELQLAKVIKSRGEVMAVLKMKGV